MTEQRPLGELFTALAHDTGTLVRKEVELAAVEMSTKAKQATRHAGLVAGGGAIALVGAIGLMGGLILALGMILPLWASALAVGALISITGGSFVMSGIRAFKGIDIAPRQTIETLEENRQWLKNQASR